MSPEALSELPQPKFEAGKIVFSSSIADLVERGRFDPARYLRRHLKGDWGDQCDTDWQSNDRAVRTGEEILMSIYYVDPALTLWILTESNRSITTLMLPDEY